MRHVALVAALAILPIAAACKKTADGEYQIKTPKITVAPDSHTVKLPEVKAPALPTVERGSRTDTTITKVPTISVKTPAERARDSAAAAKRKP